MTSAFISYVACDVLSLLITVLSTVRIFNAVSELGVIDENSNKTYNVLKCKIKNGKSPTYHYSGFMKSDADDFRVSTCNLMIWQFSTNLTACKLFLIQVLHSNCMSAAGKAQMWATTKSRVSE